MLKKNKLKIFQLISPTLVSISVFLYLFYLFFAINKHIDMSDAQLISKVEMYSIFILLFFLLLFLLSYFEKKYFYLFSILIFLFFISALYIYYNGWSLDAYFTNIILNTSLSEALSFASSMFSTYSFRIFMFKHILPAFIFLCLMFTLAKKKKANQASFRHYIILILLCESIIFLIYLQLDIKIKKDVYQTAPYTYLRRNSPNDEQVIVFMLGESSRGDHFGINGYSRDTTPLLKREKNIISFSNAHSSRLDTVSSFKVLMSNYDSKKSFFDFRINESIFSLLSKLYFETSFISTNIMTSLYSLYDRDLKNGEINLLAGYDEKILPVLENFIKKSQKNKFVMLHTYSGHHVYKQVIPDKKEFKKFNQVLSPKTIKSDACNCPWSLNGKLLDEVINDYDNTIVYTDFIIHSIIEMLKNKNAFFIYTSDHGESFGEHGQTCLHCFDEPEVWHVPFIVWASDKWISSHKQQWKLINKALEDENKNQRHISHRNIIASLLDCNDIKTDYINQNFSLCSADFYPDFFEGCERFEEKDCPKCNFKKSASVSSLNDTLFYQNIAPAEIKFTQHPSFEEKAFLHAINSPKILQEHLFEFTNFEIDVFIKNGNILTGHDPLKKEEASLEDILTMIPNKVHNIFWLDVKNLSNDNRNTFLINLENLLQKYNIKNSQIIIESPSVENLSIFTEHGFITSFYFEDINEHNRPELIKRVRKYNAHPTNCISADVKYSSVIQYLFPQHCHLFWNVEEENSQNILEDPYTKAIILSRPL